MRPGPALPSYFATESVRFPFAVQGLRLRGASNQGSSMIRHEMMSDGVTNELCTVAALTLSNH